MADTRAPSPLISSLGLREQYRDQYWRKRDPILEDRLLWRAQTFQHTVHLLPGQSILDLGCGELRFTRALVQVSRKENPITSVTFRPWPAVASDVLPDVELIQLQDFPGPLAGRKFDYVVAMDLLDRTTSSELLELVYELLAPGGEIVFYESNPWNPVHKLRGLLLRLVGKRDPRNLIDRPSLYELLSEIGFIRIYAVFNDFVFAPLTRSLIWLLRNVSILLENAPLIRTTAGSILLHAQKPPRGKEPPRTSLFAHEALRDAISVVIPCRNEEMNVRPLVERLLGYYGEYIHEIIPVDDGSTDHTAQVLSQLTTSDPRVKPIHRQPPNGVGRALRDGLASATGSYVLMLDCDFQQLLPELREMFDEAAAGYDVVIGSRFSRHSVLLNYPFLKILANRAFHSLALVLLGYRIRDVTNNLKIMRREVVADLQLLQPGFAANAETGLQPLLLGYSVHEVPISWIGRTPGMGTSSFGILDAGRGYWEVLIGLWLRRAFGRGPYQNLTKRNSDHELPATVEPDSATVP
ncbi:MAG: glycosyl transferase family 2 [Chthoniobacterales bacterium]|nr:MAG: glycosyl transferase family 2 [Chthoniobacterales bacterium]